MTMSTSAWKRTSPTSLSPPAHEHERESTSLAYLRVSAPIELVKMSGLIASDLLNSTIAGSARQHERRGGTDGAEWVVFLQRERRYERGGSGKVGGSGTQVRIHLSSSELTTPALTHSSSQI